jgi:hypothetical protein
MLAPDGRFKGVEQLAVWRRGDDSTLLMRPLLLLSAWMNGGERREQGWW